MASEAVEGAPADLRARVRAVVADNVELLVAFEDVGDDDDLFAAGLTSLGLVRLLMAVEDAFGTLLPDEVLSGETFSSISSIAATLAASPTDLPAP